MSLDSTNTDSTYLWGRLFAVYENVQAAAAGRDLNRTIRDTYFGAAMSSPAAVFPRLISLNQHHMRELKAKNVGLFIARDRLVSEIFDNFRVNNDVPTNYPLHERARFAIGYYHQRHALFAQSTAARNTVAANQGDGS